MIFTTAISAKQLREAARLRVKSDQQFGAERVQRNLSSIERKLQEAASRGEFTFRLAVRMFFYGERPEVMTRAVIEGFYHEVEKIFEPLGFVCSPSWANPNESDEDKTESAPGIFFDWREKAR